MALEDKDFIQKQINLVSEGLGKLIDKASLEALFKKEDETKQEDNDDE